MSEHVEDTVENFPDNDSEAWNLISTAIGSQYYALYHIWLSTKTYVCYQEKLPGILSLIGEEGDYIPAWEAYIDNYIVEEDRPGMREFANINTLAERLRDRASISHEYRRKNVGWTRGQFIAAKRDENGEVTNIVYAVVDINAEKTMEIAKDHALFESHRDPLTGVLNKRGFEIIVNEAKGYSEPVGFAIVDIDYFKSVNDNFGHVAGDEIIKEVSRLLSDVYRIEDSVFRIGGDEFAVLLRNCPSRAWNTICEKQKRIHASLDNLVEGACITLSAGLAFSPSGYNDDLYRMADEMLYEVKSRGRAGCASVDCQSGEKRYWKDDEISGHAKSVLSINNTGVYRIEYPLDGSKPPFMVCGDTVRELFGFPKDASPEECYRLWDEGIDPAYREALAETKRTVAKGVQAECTYKWNHPTLGSVVVRSGGYGETVNGDLVLHGYHHSMVNTEIVNRKDDKRLVIDAMSGIYFCSYYIDLENDTFSILKNAPGEELVDLRENRATATLNGFILALVANDDRERMRAFVDLSTLRKRLENEVHLDCEYLSKTDKGWCRATFFPVKRDAAGKLTHVLFVITSLDAAKAEEAKAEAANRKSIESLYNNVPGGIVMYEWDGKNLKTIHISAFYEREYGYTMNAGEGDDRSPDFERVHPEDVAGYKAAIHNALTNTHELHYDYRVWNRTEERYLWTRIDAVSEVQEDGTSLVYALYTDVTAQRELLNEYESRVNQVLGMVEGSVVVGECNLTENTVEFFEASDEMAQFVEDVKTFDERFGNAAEFVVGDRAKEEYRRTFNRENLLALAAEGRMQVRMEYLLQVPSYGTVWLESGVNMVSNPITHSITAVSYTKNVQDSRLPSLLLKSTLGREYVKTVVVIADTGEYYVLDGEDGSSGNAQHGFWDRIAPSLAPLGLSNDEIGEDFSKEAIMSKLDRDGEFAVSFDSDHFDSDGRLQIRFRYLQKSQNMLLVSLRNTTDAALIKRLRHEIEHDPITGLYNRGTVFEKCAKLLADYPDDQFVMLHVDMKHFKLYNTFFGEEAGDRLLRDVADNIRLIDRDYDHWAYGRIEADVFCLFFPFDEAKYRLHLGIAKKLLRDYRPDFTFEPVLGMYFVNDRTMPIEAMFTRATLAAKNATATNAGEAAVYDESLELALNEQHQIINEMQTAIDDEQFKVYLQPKYSLRTNKPVGAEALVRWIHPTRGMISPGKFIPVFEGNGFIITLDRYMWEHVCQLLRKWKDEGKTLAPVSVNVSRLSMFGSDTVDFLKNLVERYDIEPKYLELELTESAYIDDPDEIKANLLELRSAGFKVLLDDFGSGYSSLNTLRELPVDVLKLDLRFLPLDTVNDIQGGLVISSIVRMSKLLNLAVIAEGVEQQEHADFLKSIGCEFAQGYLFARPMPVEDYEMLLDRFGESHPSVFQHDVERVGRLIAESESDTYAMGAVLPTPLALLEYRNDDFVFLRVNPAFYEEFDLTEDLSPSSRVFRKRLTEASLDALLDALKESSQTGEKRQVSLTWEGYDGSVRKYSCVVSYAGNIGVTATMVAVFANITSDVEAFGRG